jgi:hypothetical protein
VDGIRSRFGEALVTRASLLPPAGLLPRTPNRG